MIAGRKTQQPGIPALQGDNDFDRPVISAQSRC